MKIVVLTTCHKPNDDRIYYKEILSLLSKHSKVILIAPVSTGESFHLSSRVELHSMPRLRGIVGRLVTVFQATIKVFRLNPNICHFHDLDFVIIVPFIRLFSRIKMVYDAHEVYPESMLISPNIPIPLRPWVAKIVDSIEKACVRYCSLIVTADLPNSDSFLRTGVPVMTLFNYPPLSLFQPDLKRIEELKRPYKGRRILIYQGTMSRDRGLFHMLDGMHLLKEKVPEVLLLLLGLNDINLREEADEQIERDQLGDYVQIISWVPHTEIVNYIALAEIGLVPWQPSEKNCKNIPIKVFEYMACGIPLLASNIPSIAHYITESKAGLLYDSTDAKAFAKEAKRMLDDSNMRESMSIAGKKSVERIWNWKEMEMLLLKAYAELEVA